MMVVVGSSFAAAAIQTHCLTVVHKLRFFCVLCVCVCVFVLLMDRQTERQTDRCTVSVCCRKVIRFCFFTFFVMRAEVSEVCFSVSSFGGHFSSACVYDHIQSHTCVVSALVDRCC